MGSVLVLSEEMTFASVPALTIREIPLGTRTSSSSVTVELHTVSLVRTSPLDSKGKIRINIIRTAVLIMT
jgi:hypothetical protein